METNDRLRKRALRLVDDFGINQKVLAARMGMSPGAFSKWLREKVDSPVSVHALDGLHAYEGELASVLADDKETQREREGEHVAPRSAAVGGFRRPAPPHAADAAQRRRTKGKGR
jgi:transcriptional regulator with XRE-family HTH domain